MGKIYFYNNAVLERNLNIKNFFFGVSCRCFIVAFLLACSGLLSQESVVTGLENIHISEGATIITEHTDNKITVITSSSTKTYTQEEKFSITKIDVNQSKKKVYTKKNIAKKAKGNSLKKFENIKNSALFCNTNSESSSSFESESSSSFELAIILQKQCINRSNNGNESLLKPENSWKIALVNDQTKDNIIYLFYHPKKANDSLFARPPPIV